MMTLADYAARHMTQAELEAAAAAGRLVAPLLFLHLVAGFLVVGLVYAWLDRRR